MKKHLKSHEKCNLSMHFVLFCFQVPASVRVRRESALPKPKPKASPALPSSRPMIAPPVAKQQLTIPTSAPKPKSIDDSYMAFLEDMKELGALDS